MNAEIYLKAPMFGEISAEIISYSGHGSFISGMKGPLIKQISLNVLVLLFGNKNNDFSVNYNEKVRISYLCFRPIHLHTQLCDLFG